MENEVEAITKPRTDLAIESIGHDLVVLDRKNCKIHQLNRTASIVWKGVANGGNSTTIVRSIVEQFDVSVEQAAADIKKIISEFESLQLIELKPKLSVTA